MTEKTHSVTGETVTEAAVRLDSVLFLGITDEVTSCDCCGKSRLARTVALEIDGAEVFYGTTCAAIALGRSLKDVKASARSAQDQQIACGRAFGQGMNYLADLAFEAFREWVIANGGKGREYTDNLWALGGWSEAKTKYAAATGATA